MCNGGPENVEPLGDFVVFAPCVFADDEHPTNTSAINAPTAIAEFDRLMVLATLPPSTHERSSRSTAGQSDQSIRILSIDFSFD